MKNVKVKQVASYFYSFLQEQDAASVRMNKAPREFEVLVSPVEREGVTWWVAHIDEVIWEERGNGETGPMGFDRFIENFATVPMGVEVPQGENEEQALRDALETQMKILMFNDAMEETPKPEYFGAPN